MIIKGASRERPSRISEILHGKVRRTVLVSAVVVVALPAITLGSIYYGMLLHEQKVADSFATFFENAVQTKLELGPNFVRGQLASPERLTIDIKHENFQKLAYKRDVALETGVLLTSPDDYVPAKIRHRDKTYKIHLRLKGDWIDHLEGDKWSYRVKVRGNETLFGMSKLSLHHPKTRNFIHEWIFHQALRREGIVAPRYLFVDVVVNGKPLGIYALEEHFDKRLIENNGHREGPILKLNEDSLWPDLALFGKGSLESPTGLQAEEIAHVETFRLSKTKRNPMLMAEFRKAIGLLDGFRGGAISVRHAFDDDKLAAYLALCDVMGAKHAAIWFNLRFFYNPVTSRLEPVGFDGNAGGQLEQLIGSNRSQLTDSVKFKDRCFSDPEFFGKYVAALERYSDERWLETLLDEIDSGLTRNLGILYREFPYYHFSTRVYRDNQAKVRGIIDPTRAIHAYYTRHTDDAVTVELANVQSLPVEILGLETVVGIPAWLAEPVVLASYVPAELPSYQHVEFGIPGEAGWQAGLEDSLKVRYRILGTEGGRSEQVFSWPRANPTGLETDVTRREPNADTFPFLLVDEPAGTIVVKPGSWAVDRDLVIPAGYTVSAGAGTELDIVNGATLLSRSPLDLRGTVDAPVVIRSSDASAQGVVVLEAEGTSRLEHVRFLDLGSPEVEGWNVTGAVTFYESPLESIGCEFGANRCEDALNVIRTSFDIDGATFRDTFSDAFDSDFCSGTIRRSSFLRCGNDGIDISGSTVTVQDVSVDGAGDKAVSAGESSRMTMNGVRISKANIGVASKDQCEVEGRDLVIHDTKIGLTAFRKKSEFGPASMKVHQLSLQGVETPSLVETGSTVEVDGERLAENGADLKGLLY